MPAMLINRNDPAQAAKLKELADKIAAGNVSELGREITLAQVLCLDTPIPLEIAGRQLRVRPVTVGQYVRLKPILDRHEQESKAAIDSGQDRFLLSIRQLCDILAVLISTHTDSVTSEEIQEAMPLCNFAAIQAVVEDAINPTHAQPVQ
ncbi:hypothetical protein UFOVP329_32 [uncultured Caudovirales phage]|jgi:hypothetical protein|uniref:Uncharacterized protein n=1 Tax=uncultured Caudovirales phage TaxID=2100421 RepID=A0A6J5LZT9_9CAUD|nr:hypothetical protein UFOVP329_32 [uncultured Caudovirales phage]